MSFLSRLKEKLFKSSSKIEDGLEAIIEENTDVTLDTNHNGDPSAPQTKKLESGVNYEAVEKEEPSVDNSKTAEKRTFIPKIFKKSSISSNKRRVDDSLLERLEELLISADLGVKTSLKISASFAEVHYGKKLSLSEIKEHLANEVIEILRPVTKPISLLKGGLQVVLVVGVNGSGKTTTIGKLAHQFKSNGKKVVIVAADTFRAAAVEQLEVWGKRAAVPVIKTFEGGDPAALAYEALVNAKKEDTDILMIDTAGRLQNKTDLMEELKKIVRVIRKVEPSAPQHTLLVLDASIGQNAVNQVEVFKKTADISGLVMTKLDGTAKGGILVALADRFKLPIHAIGIGEDIDDLQPFSPEEFTTALTGVEKI